MTDARLRAAKLRGYYAGFVSMRPSSLEYDRLVQQLAAATRVPPWHLTFDPLNAPTRQDPFMPDLAPCRFGVPGCRCSALTRTAPTPEETPVTETSPAVQYGVRADGEVRWPDEDDELFFRRRPGSEYGGHIKATDLPALQAAAKLSGVALVRRSLGPVEDVPASLPTTPGSVIRARVEDSDVGVCTFGLTADTDEMPWRTVGEESAYYGASEFTDVTVIFDAGAAA